MWILATLALALLLALTLRRLRYHRLMVAELHQAILRRQPFLRSQLPGTAGPTWDALCTSTNDLIREVQQLQQQRSGQLAQLEATLGSLQEAVLIVDSDNYILLANQALQAIFPDAKTILEQRLETVLHSVAFLNYVEAVRRQTAAPQHEIEFIERAETRWVEVTGTAIPALHGEKGPWVLFVLHDITKQKRLERVRKEFVANVSHELRTPLSVIKGYIETLDDGHETMPVEDRARFLRTIARHTDRLTSLLEDLLTLSRLESGNSGLQFEPVALGDLVTQLMDDFRARPAAQGYHLHTRIDAAAPRLMLDPLKLSQVLENLLDNALKYTPRGTRIMVEVQAQGGGAMLSVADNGPGIPAEDLPHIFERFYRVDKGRSREKGGTGLGLSIVKHIVQLHGGRVWAESQLGQGTTFFLTLAPKPPAA